jgi:hypothetical protein
MRTTLFKLTSVIILAVCAITLAAGQAQQAATVDPRAAATIERALEAMGGRPAWVAVQAAILKGTMREQDREGDAKSYPFTLQHDWSSGQNQPRQALTDSQGAQVATYDPDKVFTREQVAASAGKPRHPGADVLPAYLPAVLLGAIKSGGQYRVASDPHPNWHSAGEQTIAMYPAGVRRTYRPAQVWTFSKETGLPLRAQIIVANRLGTSFYKTVTFHDFQTINSLLAPKTLEVLYPDGATQTLTFDTIQFVPANRGLNLNSAR